MDRYLRICAAGDPDIGGAATPEQWNTHRPKAIWWCKAWANLSYLALFSALIALAVVALSRLSFDKTKNELGALSKANDILSAFSGIEQPKWQTQSITYDIQSDSFEIVTLERTSAAMFKVTVPGANKPSSVQRLR